MINHIRHFFYNVGFYFCCINNNTNWTLPNIYRSPKKPYWKELCNQRSHCAVLRFTLRALEPDHKELMRDTFQRESRAVMLGDPQVVLLNMNLIRAIGAKRVLDVGLYTGFSAMGAALAVPDNGTVLGMDITSSYYDKIGRKYVRRAGLDHKIQLAFTYANYTMNELIRKGESGTWDFCFIDADKLGYNSYYEQCLQLLRPRGIMTIDNVLWEGKVADPEYRVDSYTKVINELNEKIGNDTRVWKSLLPIADGLTIVVKK